MRVVFPTKGDVIVTHRKKPMVRDRHPMGIAGQVLQHVLRPAKGSLSVNDPLLSNRVRKKAANAFSFAKGSNSPWKASCLP
jgi:hypothetical protein